LARVWLVVRQGFDTYCIGKLKLRALTYLHKERPAWRVLAPKKLEAAVVTAYGLPAGLSDDPVLERLLARNLARAAEGPKTQPHMSLAIARRWCILMASER